jgi:hypothetical protein
VISHHLGGDPSTYMVFVYGHNAYGYHQANYGTAPTSYLIKDYIGLEWMRLNVRDMTLLRAPGDDNAPAKKRWDQVRVLIFKPGLPAQRGIHYVNYYFNEINMNPGETTTLYHNLGGDPGRYMVYIYGRNTKGWHQANYGTSPIQLYPTQKWIGFEWQELDSSSITLIRAPNDDYHDGVPFAKQWSTVSVLIIRTDPDSYDPPFIPLKDFYHEQMSISPGDPLRLEHGLGGFPGHYCVHVYGHNTNGYHQANYGTVPFDWPIPLKYRGLEWQEMDQDSLVLLRAPNDGESVVPEEKRWNEVDVLMIRAH